MRDACHALQEDETAAAAPSPEDGEAASPLEDGDESMVMTGELEMLNEDIRAKEEAMANMCRSALHMHICTIVTACTRVIWTVVIAESQTIITGCIV